MPLIPRSELVAVEERGWPLLVVRLPPVVSTETLRSLIEAVERADDRRQRFGIIVDTSDVTKVPGAPARRVLSDWIASPRRAQAEVAYTVATVMVVRSGPLRALTAALSLMWRRPTPHYSTATVPDAIEWLRRRLLEEKIPMTPGAEALYAEATIVGRRA